MKQKNLFLENTVKIDRFFSYTDQEKRGSLKLSESEMKAGTLLWPYRNKKDYKGILWAIGHQQIR